MTVAGIIMMIAIMVILAMLKGKASGNEAAAVAAVKTISNAANLYFFQSDTFPADLPTLATATPPYINANLAYTSSASPRDGYYYTYSLVGNTGFRVIARPSRWGATGTKCFSADQAKRILYCTTGANCNPNLDL